MLLFQDPLVIIAVAVALVVGITFHEFSHAFTAEQLGDHRVRALGRVSLNPARHIDPLGAVFFALVGFGWGRPVPVNVYALRPGRVGMAFVAAAGPLANVVVALLFAAVFRVLDIVDLRLAVVSQVIEYIVLLNFALALFNLLPIPPLDGYNAALGLLPPRYAYTLQRYEQYGFLLLLGLILLSYGPVSGPIDWIFAAARFSTGVVTGLGA